MRWKADTYLYLILYRRGFKRDKFRAKRRIELKFRYSTDENRGIAETLEKFSSNSSPT